MFKYFYEILAESLAKKLPTISKRVDKLKKKFFTLILWSHD